MHLTEPQLGVGKWSLYSEILKQQSSTNLSGSLLTLWLEFTVHCPHPEVYNGVYSIYCDCSEFHADIELEGLLLQNVSHMENVGKLYL